MSIASAAPEFYSLVAAARAIVFLTVPWSGTEQRGRTAFYRAAEQLEADHPELGVSIFAINEDAQWCTTWLATLGIPIIGQGHPIGAGSLLWLEFGQPIDYEVVGGDVTPLDIVARTVSLWPAPSTPL